MNRKLRRIWVFLAAVTLFSMVAATPVFAARPGAELETKMKRRGDGMMLVLRERMRCK